MPKIAYVSRRFSEASEVVIDQAEAIIGEYAAQGFQLTLRQLYYQFVARALIPNSQRSYKRLGSIVNDARLAGLLDWSQVVDRTRALESLSHWENPAEIVEAVGRQFHVDLWENQPNRIEVWIEKDALVGVIEGVCERYDVPYLSCRGYTSQSEMWGAAQRLLEWEAAGQTPIILHLGDHDPSGVDMSRDIEDRLEMFGVQNLVFRRLALNMDQVEEYGPPPNFAKPTDARYRRYVEDLGQKKCWELDALDPKVLDALIRDAIGDYLDADAWESDQKRQATCRRELARVAIAWPAVVKFVNRNGKKK